MGPDTIIRYTCSVCSDTCERITYYGGVPSYPAPVDGWTESLGTGYEFACPKPECRSVLEAFNAKRQSWLDAVDAALESAGPSPVFTYKRETSPASPEITAPGAPGRVFASDQEALAWPGPVVWILPSDDATISCFDMYGVDLGEVLHVVRPGFWEKPDGSDMAITANWDACGPYRGINDASVQINSECPLCGHSHYHICIQSMLRARTVLLSSGWLMRHRAQGASPPALWSSWTLTPLSVESGDLMEARPLNFVDDDERKIAEIRAEYLDEIDTQVRTQPNKIKRLLWARNRFEIDLKEARFLMETHHLYPRLAVVLSEINVVKPGSTDAD